MKFRVNSKMILAVVALLMISLLSLNAHSISVIETQDFLLLVIEDNSHRSGWLDLIVISVLREVKRIIVDAMDSTTVVLCLIIIQLC